MWTWHSTVGPEWRHEHIPDMPTYEALDWVASYAHPNSNEKWADNGTEKMYWDSVNEWVVREPI